jgi:hypothetical protein
MLKWQMMLMCPRELLKKQKALWMYTKYGIHYKRKRLFHQQPLVGVSRFELPTLPTMSGCANRIATCLNKMIREFHFDILLFSG